MATAVGDSGRPARFFLIADIRGYTGFTDEHGDEAASDLTTSFATVAGEAAEAWGGRLVEATGDEVLCVFDDPADALHASIELQDALADEAADRPSLPLSAGIGLASGDAVPVGGGFRGAALNLAARLCSVSTGGEVHAARALVEQAGPVEGLVYDEVGGLALKGLEGERVAYRVRQAAPPSLDRPAPREASRSGDGRLPSGLQVDGPFVGREADLRWLAWHWRRARHGHGRSVVLVGPPGVGKTRLAAELAKAAVADGAVVSLRTDTDPTHRAASSVAPADGSPSLEVREDMAASLGPAGQDAPRPGEQRLTVFVCRTLPGPDELAIAGSPPVREVHPLELGGIRALATELFPDDADEIPVARILAETGGMPQAATAAVGEWANRIQAERMSGAEAGAVPAERSSFVGRIGELRSVLGLLGRSRLVTLAGPPGIGKTRLALRLARAASERFSDGVVFVALASIRDARLLDSAIARALQLRESGTAPIGDVITSYLAKRKMLLVLDNFEQLVEAAGRVDELLSAAPDLKIVTTSRFALDVSGEQVYPVPPLGVPAADEDGDLETIAASDGVALFVLRAREVDPAFELRPAGAATVARIVARLEGLPLAIELAAPRARSLGLDELLAHLDRRLPLLAGKRVDGAQRHRTMRDAIAWSYELLPESEQSALRRLSVFRGGFTLEAAAAVVDRSEVEIIDGLDALLSKSFVYRADGAGHVRYGMLELIREFAAEELAAKGDADTSISRHLSWCRDLVRELEPALEGDGAVGASSRLASEIDNLRAALEAAAARGDVESSLRLAASPWRFWQSVGLLSEGRAWLEQALAMPRGELATRATATAALGGMAYWQGDFTVSRACYREARDLFAALGDRRNEAESVYSLSLVATYDDDLDAAERYATEAMELTRSLGDEAKMAEVLAARHLVAWKRGDFARAYALGEAALEIAQRLSLEPMIATQHVGLAGTAFAQGDVDRALDHASQALDLAIASGNMHTQLFALDSIASFAAMRSPLDAVRLCAAASALREEHGGGWTLEVMGVECATSAARGALTAAEVEAAQREGSSLDLEAATRLARTIGGGRPPGDAPVGADDTG